MIRKAKPIVDLPVVNAANEVTYFNPSSDQPIVYSTSHFIQQHREWVNSSENMRIKNLDMLENAFVTNGVTEAFSDFYYTHPNIRVLAGEYTYHRDLGIKVINDISEIEPNTSLIISYPYSATGNPHGAWEAILDECESKRVNVFIDCCLFGTSKTAELDLSHSAITHVAFSFSKTFATGGLRTGVLYTKTDRLTPLRVQSNHNYVQHAGMILHSKLMNEFSPDYIYNKYRNAQLQICESNNITPSGSVMFGISDDPEYDHYERDITNRMCVTYALQEFRTDLIAEHVTKT